MLIVMNESMIYVSICIVFEIYVNSKKSIHLTERFQRRKSESERLITYAVKSIVDLKIPSNNRFC